MPELVHVVCWCERYIVLVPKRTWQRWGVTHSCGHPSCVGPTGSRRPAKVLLNDHLTPVTPPWRRAA